MVDLDGAVSGKPEHAQLVEQVARETDLAVEIGGGIRDEKAIRRYLDAGLFRVILGSVAIDDPEFAKAMIGRFGARIAVGIDAKDGYARGGGWLADSRVRFTELAKSMDQAGAATIIYTDISKDGTLRGPDLAGLAELVGLVRAGVIASGGIATVEDVRAVAEAGAAGVICGKSLYKGTLSLEDALAVGRE